MGQCVLCFFQLIISFLSPLWFVWLGSNAIPIFRSCGVDYYSRLDEKMALACSCCRRSKRNGALCWCWCRKSYYGHGASCWCKRRKGCFGWPIARCRQIHCECIDFDLCLCLARLTSTPNYYSMTTADSDPDPDPDSMKGDDCRLWNCPRKSSLLDKSWGGAKFGSGVQ